MSYREEGFSLIGLLAVLIILTQPGYFIVKKLNISTGLMGACIALILSIAINGAVLYYASLVLPLTTLTVWAYAIILAVLFVLARPKIPKIELRMPQGYEKIFIVILIITLSLYFVNTSEWGQSWDSLSYHLPAIDTFVEQGQLPYFENPVNGYQAGIMTYSFAMHALIAAMNLVTGLNLQGIFVFYLILLITVSLYALSGMKSKKTLLAPLFFLLSYIVFMSGTGIHADIYLTLIFISGLFFLLKALDTGGDKYAVLNGVSFGLMVLVKPFGVLYYGGNLLFLLLHKKFRESAISLIGFVVVTAPYLIKVASWLPLMNERWGSSTLEAGYSMATYFTNFGILSESFLRLIVLSYMPVFILLALLMLKKETNGIFFKLTLFFSIGYIIGAPLNFWFYDFQNFSRFVFPIYIMACVVTAIKAKELLSTETRKKRILAIILILAFFMVSLYPLIPVNFETSSINIPQRHILEKPSKASTIYAANVPNEEGVTVFWANASDNPIIYGLENVTTLDSHVSKEPTVEPCDFLKEYEIDYVLFHHMNYNIPGPWKEFKRHLEKSILREECGEKTVYDQGWLKLTIYKTRFD